MVSGGRTRYWAEDGGGGGGAEGEGGDGVEPLVPEPEVVAPALLPEPAPQVDRRAGPRQPRATPGGGAAGVRAGAGVLPANNALLQEGQGEDGGNEFSTHPSSKVVFISGVLLMLTCQLSCSLPYGLGIDVKHKYLRLINIKKLLMVPLPTLLVLPSGMDSQSTKKLSE